MKYDNYCFPSRNEYAMIDDILLAFISTHPDVKIMLEFKDFPMRLLMFSSGAEVNFRTPESLDAIFYAVKRGGDSPWGPVVQTSRDNVWAILEGLYQELN
jgi:hypothetical protein